MKTEKQYSTLDFNGVKVQVCGNKACYVTMGNWVIYLDNSTKEQIVDTWETSDLVGNVIKDPVDQVISLKEIQEQLKVLKAENEALKAKLEKVETL